MFLKIRDGALLNESHIVVAEYDSEAKTLKVTLTVPLSFGAPVVGNPNQILLEGDEANNLWRFVSKDAKSVAPPPPATGPQYAVAGKRTPFNPI